MPTEQIISRPQSLNVCTNGLVDNFGRAMTYLRLSVTERCNLRCRYCMPEQGVLLRENEYMTWDELLRVVRIFAECGVKKLRITGGEPFVRKGIMDFLAKVIKIKGLEGVYITTNGVGVADRVADLKKMGIAGINLSLDTLDPQRFLQITRRDAFHRVIKTLEVLIENCIPTKVNAVVKTGFNTDEITRLADMARFRPIEMRFIEEMPFKGEKTKQDGVWNAEKIVQTLKNNYPNIKKISKMQSTAQLYRVEGFTGKIGIIAGYSRSFCSTCSRIRITATGEMKTCLYAGSCLNLRTLMRSKACDSIIKSALREKIGQRYRDGLEAQAARKNQILESMSTIGG